MVIESSLTGAAAAVVPTSTAIAAAQLFKIPMGDFRMYGFIGYSSSTSVWPGHVNAGAGRKGLNE